jgi:glycine/D-amino acid oxidase-like deaminating enzyme
VRAAESARTIGVAALADAVPAPFWLDSPAAPGPAPTLGADTRCDLAVIGAGFTGLWAALLAKEADPSCDVVVLEGRTAGWAASGRNGGFCSASLTHGIANGLARFPGEMPTLERLGRENLEGIETAVRRYGIDCGFERTGSLDVATQTYQVEPLRADVAEARRLGHDAVFLDQDAVRAEVNSPTYLAGAWNRTDTALLDPARLAWGLRAACLALGVRLYENSPVEALHRAGAGVRLRVRAGAVRAGRAVLATNAFPALLRRLRPYTIPVYDYALMTEPLAAAQLEAVGWRNRQGIGDVGNQFHYYRLSADNRVLWGGYDAIYHWRNGIAPEFEQRTETFERLAEHFFATFPQLVGLRFTHRWGGVIDTSTRFFAFQRTALDGRVAYSLGYTGLGVGATRFAAQVMLDLLAGRDTEATALRAVHSRPIPFPPEPLRSAGIALTRRGLARADRRQGRRGPWLRLLDRLGLGFDS